MPPDARARPSSAGPMEPPVAVGGRPRLLKEGEVLDASAPLATAKLTLQVRSGRIPVVVVACGSYSPITIMHLRMLEDTRDALNAGGDVEVIGGYVSLTHDSYGKKSLAPSYHRINMAELALEDSEWVSVDRWECSQDAWTRTAVVLQERFAKELADVKVKVGDDEPKAGLIKVVFNCGADLLESFTRMMDDGTPLWSFADQEIILGNGVAVAHRHGTDLEELFKRAERLRRYRHNIFSFVPVTKNKVSSTLVRTLLAKGLSIKYLVHEATRRYIIDNRLAELKEWQPEEPPD